MTKEELHKKLTALFLEYGAVPQGYDFSWWCRRKQEECIQKFGWDDTFEQVVEESVANMLAGYGDDS